jgi:hypothetical protein
VLVAASVRGHDGGGSVSSNVIARDVLLEVGEFLDFLLSSFVTPLEQGSLTTYITYDSKLT